jgi:hypothetical protein
MLGSIGVKAVFTSNPPLGRGLTGIIVGRAFLP